MSALATDFPGRKRSDVSPINVVQPYEPDECSENNMAPRTDDAAAIREATHGAMLAITAMAKTIESQAAQPKENGNGATNRRVTWLMAIFAMVTLFGTGANFLASSGMLVGGKATELTQTQKDVARLETQAKEDKLRLQTENDKLELRLREYEVWLQTTREKLADRGWKLPPLPKD